MEFMIMNKNGGLVGSNCSLTYQCGETTDITHIETRDKLKAIGYDDDEIIKESLIITREELLKHGYLYDAFFFSILSAIQEYDYETIGDGFEHANKEVAENILKRIIGEE